MIIKANRLSKSYKNELGSIDRVVLKAVSLELELGDTVAIMGPSGCGKTTLLNILGTLDTLDTGSLFFDDQSIDQMKEKALLAFRSKQLGFVFQFHNLLPQCTLLENVLLPTLTQKKNALHFAHRAETLLKYMGLWDQRNNKPNELSGGECQRAAVARALINSPSIILADEPTGSLDTENGDRLMDLLLDINSNFGVTLVVATHSDSVAERMNRIYRIEAGSLICTKG